MLGAVQFAGVDLRVGNHLWRIEHTELHASRKQPHQRGVDGALLEVAVPHGIEIRLVVVVIRHLGAEIDALVVHAAP